MSTIYSFKNKRAALILPLVFLLFASCGNKLEELTQAEIAERVSANNVDELLSRTVNKPYRGEEFAAGKTGGLWYDSISEDPKSFNLALAFADALTGAVVGAMHDYLLDYDYITRSFTAHCASGEVVQHENGTLSVVYTLRDDLYWSFYRSKEKIKVTSDDVVFWYNEIEGDPALQHSGYSQQFMPMPDGSLSHIDIEKIDDRRFAFHFPRLVADPLLATNTDFGPRFIFAPAKEKDGIEGVKKLFNIASDPKKIPSMGQFFLIEYSPGQRLVYARNPDYWEKDKNGVASSYPDQKIVGIVPDENTQYLLFKQGELDSQSFRPEEVDDAVFHANADDDASYTVFNAPGADYAPLWSFNQNPKNKDKPFYSWFTQKEFRQAMSCILNRERIISQVYRGLAAPKYSFFAESNPFFNPAIELEYRYNPALAEKLLASAGFKRDVKNALRDKNGVAVEFDLTIPSEIATYSDIASIIADECAKIGIKVNIRQVDFQKLVEQLMGTYDWQSIFIGLGANLFPSQGSNVWPSDTNLHLWYPLQKTPATEWEARIDYLYHEGAVTLDREKATRIWDEYQRILLEQCPIIYLVRARTLTGLHNRWDFSNAYYDNHRNLQTQWVWLK